MFWWKYVYADTTFQVDHEKYYLWARPNGQSILTPWFVIRKSGSEVVLSVGGNDPDDPSRAIETIVNSFPTEEGAKFAAELIGDPAACIKETEK